MTEKIAFVTAVESGILEAQCVRWAGSIRRHAGELSGVPIVAVKSRYGPGLACSTRKAFDRLDVRFIERRSHPKYAWYHFLNKILALVEAERVLNAERIAFLDCDVLVTKPPHEYLIPDDVDFSAAPSDEGAVGTTGPSCPHEKSWTRMCSLLGVAVEELPWVTTYLEEMRIRLYWNSGVYVYRPSTGFALKYMADCLKVLDAREGFQHGGELYVEQVVLGLSVVKHKLRWKHLPETHNYPIASFLEKQIGCEDFASAAVLHYHDALSPGFFVKIADRLKEAHPECADWIVPMGPLFNPASHRARLMREWLRVWRGVYRKQYRRALAAAYSA